MACLQILTLYDLHFVLEITHESPKEAVTIILKMGF
jgi:hypothetical protein